MKYFIFYFLFNTFFQSVGLARPTHLNKINSTFNYTVILEEQDQKYSYFLNDQEYSNNSYRVRQLNVLKKWKVLDADFILDIGFGNHYSEVTYQSGSSLFGQKITESNSSFQNPHFEFYLPTSYFLNEAEELAQVKEIFYFQFTPALFDQNATIKNNRLVEGNQFGIGYFRWIESLKYGYFTDIIFRFGDRVIDAQSNSVISKHDQNTQLNIGMMGNPFDSINRFHFYFQLQQQLDKMIINSDGDKNRSDGFNYYSLGGVYQFEVGVGQLNCEMNYTQYPTRNFKSGEYLFKISSDAVTTFKVSLDF